MKNSVKRLLGITVAGIMLFTLITIIKPCEDPPIGAAPVTVSSVRV
jgi:hypothetical protein